MNDTRNNLIIDYSTRKILDLTPKSTKLEQKKESPKIQFVPENFNIIQEDTARTETPEPISPSQVERKLLRFDVTAITISFKRNCLRKKSSSRLQDTCSRNINSLSNAFQLIQK